MKELSIKEKLEEAKRLYETANADQRYVLESLFPELEGSEDERMLKVVMQFTKENQYKYTSYKGHRYSKEAILFWLEKQGKSALEAAKEEKIDNQNCVKPADKVEPKQEWSEEDEEQFSFCCAAIELSNYSSEEYRNYAISFLESIKKRVQPQPQWKPSDDLEDFALQYAGHHAPYDDCMQEVVDAIKVGAKWQRQKDTKELQDHKVYKKGKEAGMRYMNQLMMKDAVEVDVKSDEDGLYTTETWEEMKTLLQKIDAKEGEKVKLIIIKQKEK